MTPETVKLMRAVSLAFFIIGMTSFPTHAADTTINPHCVAISNDSTITTQCDDGTVVITNTATSTVMVCHVSETTHGLPQCIKDRVVNSN